MKDIVTCALLLGAVLGGIITITSGHGEVLLGVGLAVVALLIVVALLHGLYTFFSPRHCKADGSLLPSGRRCDCYNAGSPGCRSRHPHWFGMKATWER